MKLQNVIIIKLLILLFTLQTTNTSAYLLPGRVVLNKTSENTGQGPYQIEQEVLFQMGSETVKVKETWLIENESSIRLDITSPIKATILYKNHTKYAPSALGGQTKINQDFFEKFFIYRNFENLISELVLLKIVPNNMLTKKAFVPTKDPNKNLTQETGLRLSRCDGVVCYAFGTPTPIDEANLNPGLWIEQDQFVVRKIRFPSGAEIHAQQYNEFAKDLLYPKSKQVKWADKNIQIYVHKVISKKLTLSQLSQIFKLPADTNLNPFTTNSDLNSQVTEFYTRFR